VLISNYQPPYISKHPTGPSHQVSELEPHLGRP